MCMYMYIIIIIKWLRIQTDNLNLYQLTYGTENELLDKMYN